MLEDLNLVRQRTDLEVRAKVIHQLVVYVREDLVLLSMLLDQDMQCIRVGDPADKTCVMAERDDRVASDPEILLVGLGID